MTPESQRIAVAAIVPTFRIVSDSVWWNGHGIIDPLNDLNAMHEAEKVLTGNQKGIYCQHLADRYGNLDRAIFSTATQRAEAFLKTLNLWKDS